MKNILKKNNFFTLLQQSLPFIGGNGGGKAESAQGAGKAVDGLNEAIEHIVSSCTL